MQLHVYALVSLHLFKVTLQLVKISDICTALDLIYTKLKLYATNNFVSCQKIRRSLRIRSRTGPAHVCQLKNLFEVSSSNNKRSTNGHNTVMEGAINLILSISQAKQEYLPKLIEALDENQAFASITSSHVDTIVSTINTLLNAHKTRFGGLTLLNAFIFQCRLDTLEEKGGLWVTLCTRACNQKTMVNEVSLAYEVLRKIITRSQETQQLSKLLTSSLLSKVIESCIGHVDDVQYQIIALFELCLKLYPGPTGTQRQTIQKLIVRYVDSTDTALVNRAGKCQLLLQQARGGGIQGVSLKDLWAQYQLQLIGSIQDCFDLMFSNTVETCVADLGTERLNIPQLNLSDEPITKANQLATRCGNLITYLEIALLEPFPVAKAIQPARILNLINRGLDVNCLTIAKNLISDNVAIGMLLPELHVKLFRVINSLVLILGSNLLPYCRQITKLVMQSLKWSDSGESYGGKRPFISVRLVTYDTLIKWCQMSKSGSTVESVIEQLVKYILRDSTPYENEITLQVLPGSRKYLSKKARKRLHNAHNEASNIAQKHSNVQKNNKCINYDAGNELLCAKALECLSEVLKAAGCFIKPNIHKIFQDHIISLAVATISSSAKQNLYLDCTCRRYLYKSLKNVVMCAHHLAPPPIQYTLEIISTAQIRDSSSMVRNECAGFMHDLEKLIHPNKDCLYFPIDKRELENIKYSESNLSNGKISKDVEQSEDDEEDSGDMRLILSQSSVSSEVGCNAELDIESKMQSGDANIEMDNEILSNQETESSVSQVDFKNDKESANAERSAELNSTDKIDSVTIATETNEQDIETVAPITSDDNVQMKTTNEMDTIVINEVSENEKDDETPKTPKLCNVSIETINIDSDDNVIHEITDDDEPEKKKKKIIEVEKETTTDLEVIDCEDMESCFVDEVNDNIIED